MSIENTVELPNGEVGVRFMGVATIELRRLALHNAMTARDHRMAKPVFFESDQAKYHRDDREIWALKPVSARYLSLLVSSPPVIYKPNKLSHALVRTYPGYIKHRAEKDLDTAVRELSDRHLVWTYNTKDPETGRYSLSGVETSAELWVPDGFEEPPVADLETALPDDYKFSLKGTALHDAVANLRAAQKLPVQD